MSTLPTVKKSDVTAAPIRTSRHEIVVSGINSRPHHKVPEGLGSQAASSTGEDFLRKCAILLAVRFDRRNPTAPAHCEKLQLQLVSSTTETPRIRPMSAVNDIVRLFAGSRRFARRPERASMGICLSPYRLRSSASVTPCGICRISTGSSRKWVFWCHP